MPEKNRVSEDSFRQFGKVGKRKELPLEELKTSAARALISLAEDQPLLQVDDCIAHIDKERVYKRKPKKKKNE